MITKEKAIELFGNNVKPSTVIRFDVIDTFNKNNQLGGWMCRENSSLYGAMVLTEVNEKFVRPQVIYATPKLMYPFKRATKNTSRDYIFPEVSELSVYEKLDGTNICIYSYADHKERRFVTFKTRLRPVLLNGKYGNFVDNWNKLLKRHRCLRYPECVVSGRYSLSLEMYGRANPTFPNTVFYDVDLDTRLLFGIRQSDRAIMRPSYFSDYITEELINTELSNLYDVKDVIGLYEQYQENAEKTIQRNAEGEIISGTEGFVFYIKKNDSWSMYKNKPPSVETMHWQFVAVPHDVIEATVSNAIEQADDELSVELINELLLEEFTEAQVEASQSRVENALAAMLEALEFKGMVAAVYDDLPPDLKEEGNDSIMREMSNHFDSKKMKNVYSVLKQMGLFS